MLGVSANSADTVKVGMTLLRLEVDVPAVDLDVKAVIPSMSLQNTICESFCC
jgi:hypothetical protein